MIRCAILGGNGYIGSNLHAHLQSRGWDSHQVVRGQGLGHSGRFDVVFYCIGLTADFRKRPLETVDAHVSQLLKAMSEIDCGHMIYLSSTRVYLGACGTAEDQELVVNSQSPDDLYKLSKLTGESLALNTGKRSTVARLSNVVSGENGNPDSFLYSLINEARLGKVVLRSDPATAKDYIHIDDVCELLESIALHGKHRIYNVASGQQTSHQQWIDRIQASIDCEVKIQPEADSPSFQSININRIQNDFGFKPKPVLDWINTYSQRQKVLSR